LLTNTEERRRSKRRDVLASSAAQISAGHVVEDDGKTSKLTLRDGLRFYNDQKVLASWAMQSASNSRTHAG
jgi:hypothetical protein